MKKYLFLAATTALALTSCVSDDYTGENPSGATGEVAISFDGGTGVITRAAKHGSDAATALNNNFVVYGYKTNTDDSKSKVYDHYTVNWGGAPGSTLSNSAGWEYVNQTLNMLTTLPSGAAQDIKYWDLAAKQYDFVAFSTGTATQVAADADPIAANSVAVSAITNTPSYTIKGAVADLAKCYISDRVTAVKTPTPSAIGNRLIAYKDAVQFNFRSLSSKVRMGIYEIIPGYSVRDVVFYNAAGSAAANPTLYAAAANIPGGTGTMTVTFPTTDNTLTDYNKAHVAFTGGTNTADIDFQGALKKYGKEKVEEEVTEYLGRTSSEASIANSAVDNGYVAILPATAGALTLKVDYTLVSKDGSGEKIYVKGATAVVPAEYCTWQPNYAYTYLFKISDKTNGTIGGDPAGLYPITFDAIVTQTEDGLQETITTVATPSITTYAKGAVKDEYCAGDNIYVNVQGVTVDASNLKLYTAVLAADADQELTEAAVANAIAHGVYDGTAKTYTVTDKDSKTLVVTESNIMSIVSEIDKDDAPDGNAVPLANKAGKFTAAGSTTYVAEYKVSDTEKYYKVIVVGATTRP